MSKQLASHKRLITIYCNKLEKVVASFKEDKLDALKTSESDRTPGFEKECRKKLQEGLGALEECSSRIEQAWQKYAEAYDQQDEQTETEKEDYNAYSEKAEKALIRNSDKSGCRNNTKNKGITDISQESREISYGNAGVNIKMGK
ncbi:hypothetical protein Q1695_003413 [Nippostrongylus brasiliensis]|nr:hypothetical protein Q1695_003413 [Nippostrongylus brasiliensis]